MIVGEPSLMSGEIDDEDERYITRIENTQYSSPTQQIPQLLNPNQMNLTLTSPDVTQIILK